MALLISMELVIFSSAVFFCEQAVSFFDNQQNLWKYKSDNATSPFQSIPHSFWWCFVTITTVGYGDNIPRSLPGRVIACFSMFCAVVSIAFPITIIGTKFLEVYHQYFEELAYRRHYHGSIDEIPVVDIGKLRRRMKKQVAILNGKLRETKHVVHKVSGLLDPHKKRVKGLIS
eukprot:TRINITY_DN2371_c0_g1_i5.p1 TRINITY_DN2371_c0_g1~~TRINITY_DN2371_c0_g1_i5.p1  ORF type:complete len:173 (+),score=21.88 TRINITY_DN2371_c0_g1_i5:56-574(+)